MAKNPFDRIKRYFQPVLGSDRPSLGRKEYEKLVKRLELRVLPVENEHILEVVEELDAVADNGGALLRKIQIVDDDGVFEYVRKTPNSSIYDMLSESGFLHDVLRSPELNASIDGLGTENGFSGYHWNEVDDDSGIEVDEDAPTYRKFELDWYFTMFVDGYLGWLLARGGAYSSFDGPDAEAKALGRQFEREVIGDRYESFFAWRIEETQWSPWFVGTPHWDDTLILADEDEKVLWLFMFSSSD